MQSFAVVWRSYFSVNHSLRYVNFSCHMHSAENRDASFKRNMIDVFRDSSVCSRVQWTLSIPFCEIECCQIIQVNPQTIDNRKRTMIYLCMPCCIHILNSVVYESIWTKLLLDIPIEYFTIKTEDGRVS